MSFRIWFANNKNVIADHHDDLWLTIVGAPRFIYIPLWAVENCLQLWLHIAFICQIYTLGTKQNIAD